MQNKQKEVPNLIGASFFVIHFKTCVAKYEKLKKTK